MRPPPPLPGPGGRERLLHGPGGAAGTPRGGRTPLPRTHPHRARRGGAGVPPHPHPSVGPALGRRPSRAGSSRTVPGLGLGLGLSHRGTVALGRPPGSPTSVGCGGVRSAGCRSNDPHAVSRAKSGLGAFGVNLFPPGQAFSPPYTVGFLLRRVCSLSRSLKLEVVASLGAMGCRHLGGCQQPCFCAEQNAGKPWSWGWQLVGLPRSL